MRPAHGSFPPITLLHVDSAASEYDERAESLPMQLVVSDLACVRSGRQVFAEVTFTLREGEALLVLGPNGAGKSSLLRLLAGLLRPAAGRIVLSGGDPDLTLPEQAHYLGHLDPVKPSLTVLENLAFWARYLGGATDLKPALASLGIEALADLPGEFLSAGQRRRLSLSRLIAVERPIWLLDEPTSSLDETGKVRLAEIMRRHLSRGGIIVAATHGPIGLEAPQELHLGAGCVPSARGSA
jgi:heme exporter protein A